MNRLLSLCYAALWCCMVSCAQNGYKSVGAEEFERALTADSAQLLDVRTAEEFDEYHIKGYNVKNIDIKQSDFAEKANAVLNKRYPVAVYCRSGRRSLTAADELVKAGYKVLNLRGGIIEWKEYKDGKKE